MRTAIVVVALVFVAVARPGAQAPAGSPPRIPLVPGLTIAGSAVTPLGDFEPLLAVQSVDAQSYVIVYAAEFPGEPGAAPVKAHVPRRVSFADQRAARTMRNWYMEGDAESFPGTTPFLSGAIVQDLRAGRRAPMAQLVASRAFSRQALAPERYEGTIARVEPGTVPVRVLVNGRDTDLPAIHAVATLSRAGATRRLELHVLDDPDNPIVLRRTDETGSSRVVKITYPEPERLEQALEQTCAADVHGIYFAFASAAIRPESEPVLREIAEVLRKHPDWQLRVDGHTDAVGSDASNLDLSRRRSASVVRALVDRHAIAADRLTAGGHGERVPKATNDTAEGRALNRRVELTRQCAGAVTPSRSGRD